MDSEFKELEQSFKIKKKSRPV